MTRTPPEVKYGPKAWPNKAAATTYRRPVSEPKPPAKEPKKS